MERQKGLGGIYLLIGAVVLAAVIVGVYFLGKLQGRPLEDNLTACTQDVKQCPDGSYVNRVAPSCEFKECPKGTNDKSQTDETASWKTYTNDIFSFKYPQDWQVKEQSKESLEIKPNDYKIARAVIDIFTYDNVNNLSLEELDKKLTGPSGKGPQLYSPNSKEVKLQSGLTANYSSCTIDGPAKKCEQYVIPYQNRVIKIRDVIGERDVVLNQQQIFDQIISTFKFN